MSGGDGGGNEYSSVEDDPFADLIAAEDEGKASRIGGTGDWTVDQVAEWLDGLGLSVHSPAFKTNLITGAQLHCLTEAHMVEMGVSLIGHRLLLLREIASLRRQLTANLRYEEVIWEANESKNYYGPLDWFYKVKIRPWTRKLFCQLPGFLDQYKLTASALTVTQKERVFSEVLCGGRTVKSTTRHIELEHIVSVTSSTTMATACDFGTADLITIEFDKMRSIRPLQPLIVKKGDGPEVVRKIMDGVQAQRLAAADVVKPQLIKRMSYE